MTAWTNGRLNRFSTRTSFANLQDGAGMVLPLAAARWDCHSKVSGQVLAAIVVQAGGH